MLTQAQIANRIMRMPPNRFAELEKKGYTLGTKAHIAELDSLKDILLGIGGYAVILPGIEEDIVSLLSNGSLKDDVDYDIVMVPGKPIQCHENAAFLYDCAPYRYELWTGYGMSDDGIWRQHSWCFEQASQSIIETTEQRMLYFGFHLEDEAADYFVYNNLC